MNTKHSKILEAILNKTQTELELHGGHLISIDNIFMSLLKENKGHAVRILRKMLTEVELIQVKLKLEVEINGSKPVDPISEKGIKNDDLAFLRIENTLRNMYLEMLDSNQSMLNTGHFLLVILKDSRFTVTKILAEHGVTYDKALSLMSLLPQDEDSNIASENTDEKGENNDNKFFDREHDKSHDSRESREEYISTEEQESKPVSVVEKFGIDLTTSAEEGKLDPVIGRADEIERLIQVLARRKKNNPVLIGEPGVGKSAIVEGLALRIVQKDVPYTLLSKRVFSLDIASVVAGTKYRGQFEERLKSIISELGKRDDLILFIDEIHTIMGAGSTQGTLDTANILKPALARGELQCIGSTTLKEYHDSIESDGALERRFQKIMVEPTSPSDTLVILRNIKNYYENYHLVTYTDEALAACVNLTQRYVTDRQFPDKAIDVMDEAGAKAHVSGVKLPKFISDSDAELESISAEKAVAVSTQDFELAAKLRNREILLNKNIEDRRKQWELDMQHNRVTVTESDIEAVVANMTGVPVSRLSLGELGRLKDMEKHLSSVVIGQNEAVHKITRAVQRSRAGLKDPRRPIGTFMFVGPTGVGKTHLAKELAKYMFDSDEAMIRIDMSEYSEKYNVSRLIGSPPGYVGYGEGGQLTERVRRHPYSVILFDEIEKAHSDVFNIMLQIFDDGHLTDGSGRKVDFRNCIIIMTSNVGSRETSQKVGTLGFNTSNKENVEKMNDDSIYRKSLERNFAPEFINRIDDIIIFNTLSNVDISKIIELEFSSFCSRLKGLGYGISISESAKEHLAQIGYEPRYGVRSLKRMLLDSIEEPFAEMIVEGKISSGSSIKVSKIRNKGVVLKVVD